VQTKWVASAEDERARPHLIRICRSSLLAFPSFPTQFMCRRTQPQIRWYVVLCCAACLTLHFISRAVRDTKCPLAVGLQGFPDIKVQPALQDAQEELQSQQAPVYAPGGLSGQEGAVFSLAWH
jgi:hypothetical protein